MALTETQLDEVDGHSLSGWRAAVEHTYCCDDSKNPARPLNRVEAVTEYVDSIEGLREIKFSVEAAEVEAVGPSEELLSVSVTDSISLRMYVDLNNAELYRGQAGFTRPEDFLRSRQSQRVS